MDEFQAIRPYSDAEIPSVLTRLLSDSSFLDVLAQFRFPRLAHSLGWLLRPMIAWRLRHELQHIESVAALQCKIAPYVEHTIRKATDGISYSGVDQLQPHQSYLLLANHRDIVMDPAFVNYAIFNAGMRTPRIAIGDNLLQRPFVSDLMRLNKSFIVNRSLTGRRERLAAYQQLSAYINHSILNDAESIWIAQAEGRAKDGNDRTDSAILKMLHMSRKNMPFREVLAALHPTPVAISYEYDPCDLDKARELYMKATTGNYQKAQGEDDASIAKGITGYKGRVHVHVGTPLTADQVPDDARQLAVLLDRQILTGYRLFPVHYLAYAMWDQRDSALPVPAANEMFDATEVAQAQKIWQQRLNSCPTDHRPWLVLQYAMPVRNHYCIQAGLPL